MINLFFNSDKAIEEVAALVFSKIEISDYLEGESSNVLGGYYYCSTVFGNKIKLERNSYDYEDLFNYMIHIEEKTEAGMGDVHSEKKLAGMVVSVLYHNLDMETAIEINDELLRVELDNIYELINNVSD